MSMGNAFALPARTRGFTLVEISVVLLAIGLILGAVSIGRDVQRNAEYTKIKQQFVDQWVGAYNAHYMRTGVVIGDSQTQPRMMVNGQTHAVAGSLISGHDMAAAVEPDAICESEQGQKMLRDAAMNLHQEMDRHGVRMPPGRAEGFEDRYLYLDTNGNPQELQVCFQWNKPGTPSNSGNIMVITGLTPDLARALDQMIDGRADAREGLFRLEGVANGSPGGPGVEWAGNNTQDYGTAVGSATDTSANRDEDQVVTVVAHYKMNQ